jgi:opacity protein-like surface antigen
MKRILFFIVCAVILAGSCYAQDVIVTKGAEKLSVKVIEVLENRVRYKKSANPEGPTYFMQISRISYIRYANGSVDRFDEEDIEEDIEEGREVGTSSNRQRRQVEYDDDYPVAERRATRNSSSQKPFTLSLRAGLNFNSVAFRGESGAEHPSFTTKTGFNYGILGEYAINDVVGFQSGLILNTRGVNSMEEGDKAVYSIYELQVPFFLTAGFNVSDMIRMKFHAGPTIGMGLSASVDWGVEGGNVDLYNDDNATYLKPFNPGLTVGGGLQFDAFYIGAAYDVGLSNLYVSEDYYVSIKTNSFMINGVSF